MKRTLSISLLLLVCLFTSAQNTNTKDAKEIKDLKTIVALKEYPKKVKDNEKKLIDASNEALTFAMKNGWDFNTVSDYMPLSEAKLFVKKNKGYCYVSISDGVSKSSNKTTHFQTLAYSELLSIYIPKKASAVYLPSYVGPLSNTSAMYAVMQLNKNLSNLYDNNYSSMMGMSKYVKKNAPNVIKKTLLIPKEYVSDKLSLDDFKVEYPYDFELCDLEKIEEAITSKSTQYAVAFYVPIPVNGKYFHRIYISNAEDGEIYGTLEGSKVSLDFGVLGSIGGTSNKKYLINKNQVKDLRKLVD